MRLLALGVVLMLATAAAADVSATLGHGLDAYRAGRFGDARAAFDDLADRDSAVAETMLGTMYARGQGVRRDAVTAATYWFRAANRGYAPAQLAFARVLAAGDGIPRDRDSAWVFARLAGQRGDARVARAAAAEAARIGVGLTADDRARLERRVTAWRPWASGRS